MKFKEFLWDIEKSKILDQIVENDRSIEKTLIRRGFTFVSKKSNLSRRLLIKLPYLYYKTRDRFYNLMSKESNRVILKKICTQKEKFLSSELYEYWAKGKVDNFLEELTSLRIISKNRDGSFSVINRDAEFGENLEWYISEVFKREFHCTSDWGVHIAEAPSGGDYDILARAENNIIYVESKAKKVSSVSEEGLINFLKRDEFLRPYISILFIDTTDDIEALERLFNNIGLKIRELITKHGIKSVMGEPPYTEKLDNLFFHFQSRLFVVNSKKPILETFKLCFRHRYRTGELEQAYMGRFWLHELLLRVEKWW